jgi:outer membrane protein assembly factor BamB
MLRRMLIDLDDGALAAEASRPPLRLRSGPVIVVAVLLLALAAMGASAAPAPDLRVVLTAPGNPGAMTLTSSALFVADAPNGGANSSSTIRRYPLGGGSPAWRKTVPGEVRGLQTLPGTTILLAIATGAEGENQIAFLDGDTGRQLWQLGTEISGIYQIATAGMLVTTTEGNTSILKRLDVRTGATLWSHPLEPDSNVSPATPARVVIVDPEGHATVLDFADGRVLADATLDAPLPGGATADYTADGDRLYRTVGSASLTAYHLPDLRRLWQDATGRAGAVSPCGAYLCGSTESGMSALDPRDGAVRWSVTDWRFAYDSTVLGLPGPDRLVVTDTQDRPKWALLDPATGHTIADLGHSILLKTIVLRTDTERPGRTWVQTLDARAHTRTVGAFDKILPETCAAVPHYLACPTIAGPVVVWALPAPR